MYCTTYQLRLKSTLKNIQYCSMFFVLKKNLVIYSLCDLFINALTGMRFIQDKQTVFITKRRTKTQIIDGDQR